MSEPACLSCGAENTSLWTTATDAEYKTTTERFSFYLCNACGVLFLDPVPKDRLSEIYPTNYYSYATPKRSVVTHAKEWLDGRLFGRVLRGVPGSRLRALDVGGGAGWQLDAVRAADGRVASTCVVDLDPGAEREARAKGHEYFCGRIEDFEPQEPFDFVLLLNIIEHVESPGTVLAKVGSLLNQGGAVLVKTPNYDSLDARIFRRHNWAGFHCPRHWVLFTKKSFEDLARRSGLRVALSEYTQGAPFWSASILGWLDSHGLSSITRERPVVYNPSYPLLNAAFAAFDFARMPFSHTSQMFFVLTKDA